MLDLIAEGMAIRNQRPIQVAMSASATNPPVPANIRQHPPMLKTHENPDHAEGSTAKIRQSAKSATLAIFELSIDAFNKDGLDLTHDDLLFLRHHLPFDPGMRDTALARYREIWFEAMAAEPAGHRKQNRGRFVANTWIRTTNLKTLSPMYFEKKEI